VTILFRFLMVMVCLSPWRTPTFGGVLLCCDVWSPPPGSTPGTFPAASYPVDASAIVVVEGVHGEVQRATGRSIPCGTIRRDAVASMLADEIQRECARSAVRFAALSARHGARCGRVLTRAIHLACQSDPPTLTVRKLGTGVGKHYTTIEYHWHRETAGGIDLRPFIEATVLLRARARKSMQLSWLEVCREYGVHPERLRRIARRLAGRWPPADDCAGWIGIARVYRTIVARAFSA
jgi:hypothetical protein